MNMINLEEWKLNDANLLQSIGILSRINGNPEILRTVVTARIGYELYQRLSGEREIDALHSRTIATIVKYVKDHPNAKREDMQRMIIKHILAFASDLEKL